jgi:dimethylhistidine N-methyltransferase
VNRALALDDEFARAVCSGLTRPGQKTLPCRYFYDAAGSALFDAITQLPEYGLTRAEARVIDAHARNFASAAGPAPLVVELGSGSGAKTRRILEAIGPVTYCPIDVSPAALAQCAASLADLAHVVPIEGSYLDGLRAASSHRRAGTKMLVLFLGSTIGNFESGDANEFLYGIRSELNPCDALLLGTDMVKPVARLIDAYDDPTGVTAAFNRNLLGRINRELGGNFDLRQFDHVVCYDEAAQRIEMHLRSSIDQCVRINKAKLTVHLEAGETIHTESCHKFRPEQIADMARAGGFRLENQWTDQEWGFTESLLRAVG